MREKVRCLQEYIAGIQPEFFCLLMVLGIDFLIMTFGASYHYLGDNYLIMPTMVFLGILISRRSVGKSRWHFLCGFVFCLWFALVQFSQTQRDLSTDSLGPVLSVFLLGFPFAGALRDEENQYGLKLLGMVCVGACLALAGMCGLLILGKLPWFLRHIVYWDGTRLFAASHPNMCAGIFMIGIGFCLAFSSLARKLWMKLMLWAMTAALFLLIVLTNSRTTLGMAMMLVTGYVFFWIMHKYGWKRVLIAVAVMVVLAGAMLAGIVVLRESYTQRQLEQYLEQEDPDMSKVTVNPETGEMQLMGSAGQNSFLSDLKTFNGRTSLWQGIARAMQEEPDIRLWGTDNTHRLYELGYLPFRAHGHNAWMETWARMGTPGLIMSLVLTGWFLWKVIAVLLWVNVDMWRKTIALLALCIIGTAILEPYLFFTTSAYHYVDMIFFLIMGYVTQWQLQKNF